MELRVVRMDSTSESQGMTRLNLAKADIGYSSGRKGPIAWHTSSVNVQRTREALKILIDDFVVNPTYKDTVTSIQALNEPGGFLGQQVLDVTKQYYYDSYGALRYPYGTSQQADTLLR